MTSEVSPGQLRCWTIRKRLISGELGPEIPFVIVSVRNVETPSGSYARLVDMLIGSKIVEGYSYDYVEKNTIIMDS